MLSYKSTIALIGINPFVFVPDDILKQLFEQAGKNKGFIPIRGEINAVPYKQTLVRFKGAWRLYINTSMLKNSPKRIGECIDISVEFDPKDRTIEPNIELVRALDENPVAKKVFTNLSPSKQNEIVRYISRLKSSESVTINVARAINFLLGKERFIGQMLKKKQ